LPEFVSKLGDTTLWAAIGAGVLGLFLKLIQSIQSFRHRHEDKPIVMKVEPK
jgi:hypothetical protein